MHMLNKRLLRVLLLAVAVLFSSGGGVASAAEPVAAKVVLYNAAGNPIASGYAAEKGVGKHLTARVFDRDGRLMNADVQWRMDDHGPGYVVPDASGPGATVVMTKDLYDDPNGFEPWTNLRACSGGVCAWLCVKSVVNLTGQWRVYIKVTNALFGSKWVVVQFKQDGRNLLATGISEKPMTATLNGRALQFYDPNRQLTSFSGALVQKNHAEGRWVSYEEYEGNWYASR